MEKLHSLLLYVGICYNNAPISFMQLKKKFTFMENWRGFYGNRP